MRITFESNRDREEFDMVYASMDERDVSDKELISADKK